MRSLTLTTSRAPIRVALLCGLLFCSACAQTGKVTPYDPIERLKQDIARARYAVRTTKALIDTARGEAYLPDLYMQLAELYVAQARYFYLVAAERQKDRTAGVVSIQSRVLKNQAVATYRRLLSHFPDFRDEDKILFFMAHEMRELGDYDAMIKTYLDLADRFPSSKYRLEGLLVVGDHYFDKAELDRAEKYYRMVINSPETRAHAMARYKLAWCRINRADFKGALKLFEGSVAAARKFLVPGTDTRGGEGKKGARKIDLRREALVDSSFCYTEVHKPDKALEYFRSRSDSKTTYLAALVKLGNRYYVKQNWSATAMIYREVLSLSGSTEDSLEYAHRLFEAVRDGKLHDPRQGGASDIELLVDVIRRQHYHHRLSVKERAGLLATFEQYTRFMAIKLHEAAADAEEEAVFLQAARAYRAYLSFFDKSKHAGLIRANLAGTLYAAKRYLEAGKIFEAAAPSQKGKEQNDSIFTAVAAYFEALRAKETLTRLDVVQAMAGLRRAGRLFIKRFPKDPRLVKVKFNIARTYYDSGEFERAIHLFRSLVAQFHASKEAVIGAHLVLDSYHNLEDYEGLITAGKAFAARADLGDAEFKRDVTEIVKGAQNRLLEKATLGSAIEVTGGEARRLEEIAEKFKGTEVECRALLNAVVSARSAADTKKIFETGEKLIRTCPAMDELPGVLASLGKEAVRAFQFSRAARYFEAAARKKKGDESASLLRAATGIHAGLGLRKEAEKPLATFLRLQQSAEEKAKMTTRVARLHIQAQDWRAAVGLLQSAMTEGALSTEMLHMLGYGLFRMESFADAQSYLVQAVEQGMAGGPAERQAAAAAQFYLGEIAFATFLAIQLSSDLSQLGPTLQQKLSAMTQARAAYRHVLKMRNAVWSVAALARLGSVDQLAAAALRELEIPEGVTPALIQQVREAMESQAAPLASEAKEAIKQCAKTAVKFKVLSMAARSCLAGKAASSDPQSSLAVPMINRTRPGQAASLEKILVSKPKDLATITRLGKVYLKAGDPYMARMVIGKGLEVKETAPLLNLLGVATFKLGDPQMALTLFGKALKVDAGHSFARLNKASLLRRYGYSKAGRAAAGEASAGSYDKTDPRLIPTTAGILE